LIKLLYRKSINLIIHKIKRNKEILALSPKVAKNDGKVYV
jgi:hypothetical protein